MPKDYISENDLVNKRIQLEKEVNKLFERTKKEAKRSLVPIVSQNLAKAQDLILSEYKALAYSVFQEEFMLTYGEKNYVPQSLNDSLKITIESLVPKLSYDKSKFIVKCDYGKDERQFNQNANVEGSFERLMDFDELDALEEAEFYGLSFDYDDGPYEYAEEQLSAELDDIQVFKHNDIIRKPEYTFLSAYNTFQKKWIELYPNIAQFIKNKYNIDLYTL